jgi:hypothetical protein
VSFGPSLRSIKRASEADLGIPLQSGSKTLRHGKYNGSVVATFLLAETSTGCQQVYPVMHCLCYCQNDH